MTDINVVKIEPKIDGNLFGWLNPMNWFKKTYTKDTVNILFIDDLDMPVVKNLRKAGYRVRKVNDINNPEDFEIKNAQIIFIDFDGVGRRISEHQGAGVVREIKRIFGNSKYVVLYTAQPTIPTDTILKEMFDAADAKLRKDADTTDFTEQIRVALARIE